MTRLFVALWSVGVLSASAGHVVVWEAESAQSVEAPMVVVVTSSPTAGVTVVTGSSGDSYLDIPEGRGNPPKVLTGKAVYEVAVPADDEYVLWARVYWEGECSNSLGVTIGQAKAFSFGQDATYKSWHWVRSPRRLKQLRLTQGPQAIVFANREDGVRVDQIALSSDKRWVPVGVEKIRP